MSVLTTEKLGSSVGAEVLGVDRERLLHDDELPAATLEALEANGALVFRDLHVDDEAQVAFSRKLGKVEVLGKGELPEIFRVTLDPAKNPVAAYLRGTFDWHLDGATDDIPIMATVLSTHTVAASGGETEFSSTYTAYDDLSDADKERYLKVRVVHSFEAAQRLTTPDPSPEELAMWRKRPSKTHPLVWQHQSGRRSLVLGATTSHVEDMEPDEGRALLDELLGVVDDTRPRLPARMVGRRHGHLGQPRRVAPRASLRRGVGTRHAPHDHLRRGADPMTASPRIPPLPPDQWGDDVMQAIGVLRPAGATQELRRSKGGPKGLNVLGTLAQHPTLMHAYHSFNGHILYTNTLSARQRELLVLRVAARRGAEYEWQQHVRIARDAGISDAEIERIAEGSGADGWSPVDAALLRAVDELLADALITDATWSVLADALDRHQLMDLVFTVGAYDLLAMAFKSFGVELDADLVPE